jgi:hypothetical protein
LIIGSFLQPATPIRVSVAFGYPPWRSCRNFIYESHGFSQVHQGDPAIDKGRIKGRGNKAKGAIKSEAGKALGAIQSLAPKVNAIS